MGVWMGVIQTPRLGIKVAAGRARPSDPANKRDSDPPSVGSALHCPAVAMTPVTAARLPQHDAGYGFLLLIERFVEGLEHLGEGFHLRRPLCHALAGAVEPLGQRSLRRVLLARLSALLARLLALGGGRAQL